MLGWILKVAALAVLIAVLLYLRSYYVFLRRPQKADEKVLPARRREAQADQALEAAPKKALLLYQDSRHGTLGRMAQIVAEDILCYNFHPTQTVTQQPDGSVLVNFQASGELEIIWHLFKWGGDVKILSPERLKETYRNYIKTINLD